MGLQQVTKAAETLVTQGVKKLKYVKEYRLGNFGEGDQGVTIVVFKEK